MDLHKNLLTWFVQKLWLQRNPKCKCKSVGSELSRTESKELDKLVLTNADLFSAKGEVNMWDVTRVRGPVCGYVNNKQAAQRY